MPVCLTGDVHHSSLETADQAALSRPEPETARTYASIVNTYDLRATLFVTGRTAIEDPDTVRALGDRKELEIGGHNYGAFTVPGIPKGGLLFSAYRRLFDLNCPGWVQRRGIERTIAALEETTGDEVVSWRDHAFLRDRHTYDLLAAGGIRCVSDERDPERTSPYRVSTTAGSIVEVPVNVPPDHDHLSHGTYDPPDGWSDPFSGEVYSGEEWLDRVLDLVAEIDAEGGVATVLAHPACMDLVDGFDTFENLCEGLAQYRSVTLAQAGLGLD